MDSVKFIKSGIMAAVIAFSAVLAGADDNDEASSFVQHLVEKFNLSEEQAMAVATVSDTPADALAIVRFSLISDKPVEEVLTFYQWHKKRGWGAIARELGVKPGSEQFLIATNAKSESSDATDSEVKSNQGKSQSNKGQSNKGQSDKGKSKDKGKPN